MGPVGHTLSAVGIGAVAWFTTGSPLAIPVALATGVLVDVDHVADFFDGMLAYVGETKVLLWAIAVLAVKLLFLYLMYRKRIFLKV